MYREYKSTIDQIFIINLILQTMREHNKKVHTLFIDFKIAYDFTVLLKQFGLPLKLVKFIKANIMRIETMVRVGNFLSLAAHIIVELR